LNWNPPIGQRLNCRNIEAELCGFPFGIGTMQFTITENYSGKKFPPPRRVTPVSGSEANMRTSFLFCARLIGLGALAMSVFRSVQVQAEGPIAAPAKAANIAERCAEGILKIRSYDVTYSLGTLNYPNPTEPDKPNVPTRDNTIENKRDVLAFGLGRRFEDFHGTDLQITTVMDWKTASLRENLSPAVKVAAALTMLGGGGGNSYLDYFNPNCSGFFLADLLRDSKLTIHMLDSSPPAKGLVGFEVEHPQVREPVRVWADPEHGYMPSIIESYFINKNDQRELDERTQVQEFIKIGDDTWVPIKGINDILLASGLNTGKPYTAILLVVNLGQSSWNSINSGTGK
jgi:hypothetical protein